MILHNTQTPLDSQGYKALVGALDWENCQNMMDDPYAFLQKLEKFDVQKVPDDMVKCLEPMIKQPFWNYDGLKGQSLPSAYLAKWVASVTECSKYYKQIEVWTRRMKDAQEALETAEVEERRIKMDELQTKIYNLRAIPPHKVKEGDRTALVEAEKTLSAVEAEPGHVALDIKALPPGNVAHLGVRTVACFVMDLYAPWARDMGWRLGDRILSVNGERIYTQDQCRRAIAVNVAALDTDDKPIRIIVKRRDPKVPPLALVEVDEYLPGPHGGFGIRIENCKVTKFEVYKAQTFGWTLGDRIINVNGIETNTSTQCNKALTFHRKALASEKKPIHIVVIRYGDHQ